MLQSFATGERYSVGDLLDAAIRVYREHFGRLALTAAVFLVPIAVLATLLFGVTIGAASGELFTGASEESAAGLVLGRLGAFLLVTVGGYVATLLAFGSLLAQTLALMEGQELRLGEAVRRGLRRLLPLLGLLIVYSIVIFAVTFLLYIGAMFVFFVFATMLGAFTSMAGDNTVLLVVFGVVTGLFVLLAALVVMVPVITLTARWSVAPLLIYAEQCGPLGALSRSWHLTSNNTGRASFYLVLLFLFNLLVLGLPAAVVQMGLNFFTTPQMLSAAGGLGMGISYFINVLWYPLLSLALVFLYFDLRVRNEDLDLDLRILQLEQDVHPPRGLE